DCHLQSSPVARQFGIVAMNPDARARFRDLVALHLEAHKIFPEIEERKLIAHGISDFELEGDQARGQIAALAAQCDCILESQVSRSMLNVLHEISGKGGAISKRRFERALVILKALVKGRIEDAAARAWLKRIVESGELKVRGGGLFRRKRWFRKIKAVA